MNHLPQLGLIWAQARNGTIGQQGQMPWHLPEDLAHFKAKTMGSAVIMGRKTWDSIPPPFRPLPGRRNIVLTHQADWQSPGAERASSVEEAMYLCQGQSRVWVIGGGQIYEQALPYADWVEMTQIDLSVKGDTRAPKLDEDWLRGETSEWKKSQTNLRYRFASYRRTNTPKVPGANSSFSSTLTQNEFPSTQSPTGFPNTQSPTGFSHTQEPSEFHSTLPPGLTL